MLAIITKMTLTQVSTWFANARRRLKKENKMTWSPRNRCGEKKDDNDDAGSDSEGEHSSEEDKLGDDNDEDRSSLKGMPSKHLFMNKRVIRKLVFKKEKTANTLMCLLTVLRINSCDSTSRL